MYMRGCSEARYSPPDSYRDSLFLSNSPLYFHLSPICRALELARSWLVGGYILRRSHPGYPFPVSASDNSQPAPDNGKIKQNAILVFTALKNSQ